MTANKIATASNKPATTILRVEMFTMFFPSAMLFQACSPWLQPEMELASTYFEEPSVAWHFRGRIRGFHQIQAAQDLPGFMSRSGPRLCLLPTERVLALFPQIPAGWKQARTIGFNAANGAHVDLAAWVKTTAGES